MTGCTVGREPFIVSLVLLELNPSYMHNDIDMKYILCIAVLTAWSSKQDYLVPNMATIHRVWCRVFTRPKLPKNASWRESGLVGLFTHAQRTPQPPVTHVSLWRSCIVITLDIIESPITIVLIFPRLSLDQVYIIHSTSIKCIAVCYILPQVVEGESGNYVISPRPVCPLRKVGEVLRWYGIFQSIGYPCRSVAQRRYSSR